MLSRCAVCEPHTLQVQTRATTTRTQCTRKAAACAIEFADTLKAKTRKHFLGINLWEMVLSHLEKLLAHGPRVALTEEGGMYNVVQHAHSFRPARKRSRSDHATGIVLLLRGEEMGDRKRGEREGERRQGRERGREMRPITVLQLQRHIM